MKKKIYIENKNKNKNYTNISQKFLPDSGINLFFLIHNYDYDKTNYLYIFMNKIIIIMN